MPELRCQNCGRVSRIDERMLGEAAAVRCWCDEIIRGSPQSSTIGRLGRYDLTRRIAAGGMGEVYLGKSRGVAGFERDVAIKKLLPHLAGDSSFVAMMAREAKLTVQLQHANIVQVFDFANDRDDYFIAMEYVPGVTVAQLMVAATTAGLPIPVEVAVHVGIEVLQGLSYAHALRGEDGTRLGLLHRDIKPQNVLVTREGWVKLTDFGIAKVLDEASTTGSALKGTLGYMAPEQLEGRRPDQRADLFCAAIVIWEMLAGYRLFSGDNPMHVVRLITEARVPPLNDTRYEVPSALEEVLRRALSREPDDRFSTAEDLRAALTESIAPRTSVDCAATTQAFLAEHPRLFAPLDELSEEGEDRPTVPIGDGRILHVRDLAPVVASHRRRDRIPRLGTLLAALVFAGLGVGYTIERAMRPRPFVPSEPSEPPKSSRPPAAMNDVARAAAAIAAREDGEDSSPATDSDLDTSAKSNLDDDAIKGLIRCIEGDPEQKTSCRALLLAKCTDLGQGPRAVACFKRYMELVPDRAPFATAANEEIVPRDVSRFYALGVEAMRRGNNGKAIRQFDDCVLFDRQAARCFRGLGIVHARTKNVEEAIRNYRRYLSLSPNAPDAKSIRAYIEQSKRSRRR